MKDSFGAMDTNLDNRSDGAQSAAAAPSAARRTWLKGAAAMAGLTLGVGLSGMVRAVAAEGPKFGGEAMPGGLVDDPLVFVSIGTDGIVTIVAHRSEMGQGVRTSLPMVVADELEADWSKVRVIQATADQAKVGNQNTDGSRSMRHSFEPMRRIGAAARGMLEMAAAQQWRVPLEEVQAQFHEVVHAGSGRRLAYADLAAAAASLAPPTGKALRLKTPAQFRYIGKEQVRGVDLHDIVTGNTQYGIDTRLPGMLYAVVARPMVMGGKVVRFDAGAALKVKGVIKVVEIKPSPAPAAFHPMGGVAVIASNTWAAIKGRDALKITWDDGPHAHYDSAEYKQTLQAAARAPAKAVRNDGDAMAALARSGHRFDAEYYLPHIAHATMETPAAVARCADGKCEVWACVQAPQATCDIVAEHLGIKPADVTVHVTLLGGGFGRKSKPDFVAEAALLSQAMNGAAVKLTWTREDDIHHDYFHTVSVERLEAALDEHGKPTAWLHRTAAPTIGSLFVAGAKGEQPFELGMGAVNVPFAIPNLRVEAAEVEAHTRIGWFRSVSNIPHTFATQSFVAELAAAARRDHRDYLLELIGPARKIAPHAMADDWNYGESPERYPFDTGRMRQVVSLASDKAGWGRKLADGHGLGLAVSYSFVTYVAVVMEVAVAANGELTIPRVDIAVDCGPQVNPDRIRSQLEGACIMGISLALSGEISFKNGRAEQGNFHEYEILRSIGAPRAIHVHFTPHDFTVPLGGVGEPGTPPIAPALCNAIFAATGKRIRNLPIRNQLGAG